MYSVALRPVLSESLQRMRAASQPVDVAERSLVDTGHATAEHAAGDTESPEIEVKEKTRHCTMMIHE